LRTVATTFHPAVANLSTVALPSPVAVPVTTITLFTGCSLLQRLAPSPSRPTASLYESTGLL
jgi:hypothetical protein